MSRRRDEESDDSVLVSSDEENISSDEDGNRSDGEEHVDEDGYGSLEDEVREEAGVEMGNDDG